MPRLGLLILVTLAACQSETPSGQTYYDRVIQPILSESCSRGTSGCHAADPQDPFAFSAGNLDLTSFASVHKRPDVLRTFGVYPAPLLLMKAVGETSDLSIVYRGRELPLLIPHAGGNIFQVSSPAFLTLQTWLENGATIDGQRPAPEANHGTGDCSTDVPLAFQPPPEYAQFAGEFDGVQEVLTRKGCNAGTCHGAPQSDFYLTCGSDTAQTTFNFHQVWAFVADPVEDSEVLRRPVAGGASHTGGVHFSGAEDPDYLTMKTFASDVGPMPSDLDGDFFVENVMPALLQRGCAVEGCHSPAAMNDFKMRSGSQGFFSPIALEKNLDLVRREFMAFEAPDVRRGRLVAKNVFPGHGGIPHRGGALLEAGEGGADPAACPTPYDAATASPFCTIIEWGRRVGAAPMSTIPLIYVERAATHLATPLQFTTYQPGSDLLVADAALDANGSIVSLGAPRSLLDGCAGATARTAVDVRSPDVAGDGTRIAFAMRTSSGEGLQVWTVNLDGSACTRLTSGADNFDPAWSPDGEFIVYASSQAGGMTKRLHLAQSDIWRMRADGSAPDRVTVLSNSELEPQFMRDGRISMTTEKVDPRDPAGGFYQLSGRRINWDLTDYHPLLAQRAQSPVDPASPAAMNPSIGYQQATEIREGLDGDFLIILSNPGAKGGAGTLAVFNRSIGPFEQGRGDPGYLRSVSFPDASGTGVYRSPYPLLDGKILASYAPVADPAAATSLDWDLVAVDPQTGARTPILAAPGAQVEAVLALAYAPRPFYQNQRQLVFGGGTDADTGYATVHFPDAPMLATLLGANLRRGRDVAGFRAADKLSLFDAAGTLMGSAPLAGDGSARVRVPARKPTYFGLYQGGTALFVMSEEHQFGPGERISIGVPESQFDRVCAGCHGSVSGQELDIAVNPDALTGASQSASAAADPVTIGN